MSHSIVLTQGKIIFEMPTCLTQTKKYVDKSVATFSLL